MKTKICSKCGIEKSIDNFSKDAKRKDGLHIYCRACRADYEVVYVRKLRLEAIQALGGKCAEPNCTYCIDDPLLLEIHHIGGVRDGDLDNCDGKNSHQKFYNWCINHPDRLDLLCPNHHAKRNRVEERKLRAQGKRPKNGKNYKKGDPIIVDMPEYGYKTCSVCINTYSKNNFDSESGKSKRQICRTCLNTQCAKIRYNHKLKIFNELFGGKCNNCDVTDIDMIHFDHKNGGGAEEFGTRVRRGGVYARGKRRLPDTTIHKIIEREPERFQALCAVCNQRKKILNRECRRC
jgi:hypothetical protein